MLLGVFKVLMLVFWWVVLVNLFMPMVWPFRAWVNLAGAAMLVLHVLELFAFNGHLRDRSHRNIDRMQVLLLGVFHIQSVPAPISRPQ
ncbi:DUF1145 domain-containing protein [Pseudomonas typographi]|uniref:DUF1145 domain-containing protein n=1 Tax=Pseudomonas typographi TaxID=2715964 RepID=UPI0016889F0F|nr:DUF1145 domain-containing protein [Pseudomonas typographi]MBD1554214.1 DUF1145 domain-containing protein [Pseudomonas typographi]MBD1586680.1 DUF1145 domain-containing protein [Pseudomonas typographi]